MIRLIDKSVNNHPEQHVNHHCLDKRLPPSVPNQKDKNQAVFAWFFLRNLFNPD